MDTPLEMLHRVALDLLERTAGPLHFRFVCMPVVVTVLAVRAGLRDARSGEAAFLGALWFRRDSRASRLRSVRADLGRVLLMATLLDTVYQVGVLRAFYPLELLLVVGGCAVLPYLLIRGPVTRLARRFGAGPEPGTGIPGAATGAAGTPEGPGPTA